MSTAVEAPKGETFPAVMSQADIDKTNDAWDKLVATNAEDGVENPYRTYQEACERSPENKEIYTRGLILSLTRMATELSVQTQILKMIISAVSGGQNPGQQG